MNALAAASITANATMALVLVGWTPIALFLGLGLAHRLVLLNPSPETKRMRPKTRTTVTDNDVRILHALASGPKTNRDLQGSAGMHRRSIFTSLRRLEKSGLITRRHLLRDARMTVWSLAVMPDAIQQVYAAPERFA